MAKRQAAIYADDGGVLHTVAIAGSPVDLTDTPSKVVVSTSPGSISVAQGNEVQLFIGDGKRLRAIAVTDAFTVLDPNIVPFVAAGPITAAAATDASGRLYVPSADGNLYLVRRPLLAPGSDDNTLESPDSFLTDGALTAPPALTPGRVYFGSADGNLYLLADEALP